MSETREVWKIFAYISTILNLKVDAVLVKMARIYNESCDKVNYQEFHESEASLDLSVNENWLQLLKLT